MIKIPQYILKKKKQNETTASRFRILGNFYPFVRLPSVATFECVSTEMLLLFLV